MLRTKTRFTLAYCVLLVLFDFMGLTITVVTFPKLMLSLNHSILPQSLSYGHKFALMGVLLALYPLGQFFGASVFGKLSDHHGRKKVLMMTLAGTFAGFVLSAVSIASSWPLLLFASRLITGVFAGNVAVAQAIITDVSTDQTKGRNISFSQTAMGMAFIFGPILGAYLSSPTLVEWFNFSTPYWFFCLLFLIFFVFSAFFFEETLAPASCAKINFSEGLQQVYQGFTSKRCRLILFVWFLFCFGWWLFEAFMPAYLYTRFHFTVLQVGHLLTFNGTLFVLSQMLVVSRVAKRVKPQSLVKSAAIFAGLGMISLAYVPLHFVYLSMIFFVLGMSFSLPGLITSLANLESDQSQGQMMGIINSTQAFATILVMLLGGLVYIFHGSATVIVGGVVTIVAWVLYSLLFDRLRQAA